ncbi:MAG: YczE/YyaS/YitT family protein [Oscillospiraceae bacterium]|jgi:uncharacterized membrane protein YczE
MKQKAIHWIKRFAVYVFGLFIIAFGVSVSKMSDLGVSPVNSIPCVISEILQIDMGICTTCVFIGFILLQILIVQKDFQWKNLLQILCSTLFGSFVSLTNRIAKMLLPVCSNYGMRLVYVGISVILVAVGILLYIEADVLPLPSEGVMQAVSYKTKLAFSTAKLGFDWTVVIISAMLSLIFMKGLVGVREGTVIAAFGVGICLKVVTKFLQTPLRTFLFHDGEGCSKVEV